MPLSYTQVLNWVRDQAEKESDLQQYVPHLQSNTILRLLQQVTSPFPSSPLPLPTPPLPTPCKITTIQVPPLPNPCHLSTEHANTYLWFFLSPCIQQVAQIYQSIEFSRLASLVPFVDAFQLERSIVDAARHCDLQV